MTKLRYAMLALLPLLLLMGCSSSSDRQVFEDRKYEYRKQTDAGKDLEVPPDLTRGSVGSSLVLPGGEEGATRYSEFDRLQQARNQGVTPAGGVLPAANGIQVRRDGDQRWLQIDAAPQAVWGQVVEFWRDSGILLTEQNPALGVMSTDWIENRDDIPSDFITDKVRGVFDGLYSAPTRDQYRVRLEEGDKPGTTALFLTHRGVVQEFATTTTHETEQAVWQPRPSDPEAEAEMLRRLMVYLGVREQQAAERLAERKQAGPGTTLVKDEKSLELRIDEDFARSWRVVGVALDRVGFLVEDRDRDQGYFLVRYDDPLAEQRKKGMLSRLAFWNDNAETADLLYRIALEGQGGSTLVRVRSEAGELLRNATAERLLTLVQEQLD